MTQGEIVRTSVVVFKPNVPKSPTIAGRHTYSVNERAELIQSKRMSKFSTFTFLHCWVLLTDSFAFSGLLDMLELFRFSGEFILLDPFGHWKDWKEKKKKKTQKCFVIAAGVCLLSERKFKVRTSLCSADILTRSTSFSIYFTVK